MKFIKSFAVAAIAYLLQSCFNTDDYIFNEADTSEIKVEASVSRSIIETTPLTKADTFLITDTVYFLTRITPSKVIKLQNYQWLMDGKYCSSDYNFKKQIEEPGHHKFTFVLKDHFGDMHYDSVDVWVAGHPTLNDSAFIPAEGTQAIDPNETVYFTWSAKTEGIDLKHHYHFTLSEQKFANTETNFSTIDTILSEPHFTLHNKLNPFTKYNWTVQAFNEYNFASAESIESFFYTKGIPGEGSLQATIDIGQATSIPIRLTLKNKTDKQFSYKFNLSRSNNEISLGAIPSGNYNLTIKTDYPDFGTIQQDVKINDGFVTTTKRLTLIDSIPPTIYSISKLDTIVFEDTLRFVVKDGSKAISNQNIIVRLEDELVANHFYNDSILTVVLKETDKSWAYRILSVSAVDGSNNGTAKYFYIRPSTLWFQANDDTTIDKDGIITMFIYDRNPYGFKVDSLKLFNLTKNETIISVPSTNNTGHFSAELEASLFDEKQTIESTVIYQNGIRQSKAWKLYVKDAATKKEEN
jgi:hypothetical protein